MSVVAVMAREHRKGREKERKKERGRERGRSIRMSLLFSRYPRLGAIVIDWRCGTSPDPLYPSLSFPFSPFFLSLSLSLPPTLACYIDSLFIVWQPPSAPSMKACAPTHYHVQDSDRLWGVVSSLFVPITFLLFRRERIFFFKNVITVSINSFFLPVDWYCLVSLFSCSRIMASRRFLSDVTPI